MSKLSAQAAQSQVILLSAFDREVRIRVAGDLADDARSAIETGWSWCQPTSQASTSSVDIEVFVDSDAARVKKASTVGVLATTSLTAMMHYLSQIITVACIDSRAGEWLMLHAGAVADPQNRRAVAVVAASGTGKTTFIQTLGRARTYLSDETVIIRDDNTLLPYPKPLSLKVDSDQEFKRQANPEELALLRPSGTYALCALWFLERSPLPMTPQLDEFATLDALMAITPQVSHLPSLAAPLQRLSALFDAVGGLTKVAYHEVSDLEPFLVDALRGTV